MGFHFARLQDDGRLTSPLPETFDTAEAARAAAPDLLIRHRNGGGRIVLVQVIEAVEVTASLRWEKLPEGSRRKLGRSSPPQPFDYP
jgi:hypothetical protein